MIDPAKALAIVTDATIRTDFLDGVKALEEGVARIEAAIARFKALSA